MTFARPAGMSDAVTAATTTTPWSAPVWTPSPRAVTVSDFCEAILYDATYFDPGVYCDELAEDGEDFCLKHLGDG